MNLPIHQDLKRAAIEGPFRRFAKLLAALVGFGALIITATAGVIVALVAAWRDTPVVVWVLAVTCLIAWGTWGLYAWMRRPSPAPAEPSTPDEPEAFSVAVHGEIPDGFHAVIEPGKPRRAKPVVDPPAVTPIKPRTRR